MTLGFEGGPKMARRWRDIPHCALHKPFKVTLSRYSINKYAKDIVLTPLTLRGIIERGEIVEFEGFIPYRGVFRTQWRHEHIFGLGRCALNRTSSGKLSRDVNCAKYVIFRGGQFFLLVYRRRVQTGMFVFAFPGSAVLCWSGCTCPSYSSAVCVTNSSAKCMRRIRATSISHSPIPFQGSTDLLPGAVFLRS